jgi:hypothetical protein
LSNVFQNSFSLKIRSTREIETGAFFFFRNRSRAEPHIGGLELWSFVCETAGRSHSALVLASNPHTIHAVHEPVQPDNRHRNRLEKKERERGASRASGSQQI